MLKVLISKVRVYVRKFKFSGKIVISLGGGDKMKRVTMFKDCVRNLVSKGSIIIISPKDPKISESILMGILVCINPMT